MKKKIIIILLAFVIGDKLSAQFVDASATSTLTDTSLTDIVLRNRAVNGGTFQYMTPTMFKAFMSSLITYGTSRGTNVKIWDTTFTPSVSSGQTVDISSAGFSSPPMVFVTAERNTAVATSVPQISLKSRTSTQLSFNIIEGSANLVTILGISVLSGVPTVFVATPSTVVIHVFCIGS